MSILNWKCRRLVIIQKSTTYNAKNDSYVIEFMIYSCDLAGHDATVVLLPGKAEPLIKGSTDTLAFLELKLDDTSKLLTIEVPAPAVRKVTTPPNEFYLLLGSGERIASSDYFVIKPSAATPPAPTTPNPHPVGVYPPPPASADPTTVGKVFRPVLKYKKYGAGYVYSGKTQLQMSRYARWSDLIAAHKATADEELAISVMSLNEGPFDAVNAWDDQIVSLGAMQKTINKAGKGELTQQIAEFRRDNPALYQSLLGQYGWDISAQGATYTDPATGKKYSGTALFNKLREGAATLTTAKNKQGQQSAALAPLVRLGQNEVFQDKQVTDFIARMRSVLALKPVNCNYTIAEYFTMPISRTVVLDQSVNRPGHVTNYVSAAIAILRTGHPEINENPNLWGANHAAYEKQLLEIYGPLREHKLEANGRKKQNGMTAGEARYRAIKAAFKKKGHPL